MDSIFELKAIVDGVECRIKKIFSLTECVQYFTPSFSLAGSTWKVYISKSSRQIMSPSGTFKRTTSGSIDLQLERLNSNSYSPISTEYTFSIKMRNGNEYGEERRTRVFKCGVPSCLIAITLDSQRLSQLMPDDTLTVICRLRRMDLTVCAVPDVTQFKKKFEENTDELVSVKKKLEEKTAELVSVKKTLEEKTAELVSVKKELENEHSEYSSEVKSAELDFVKKELENKQIELNKLKCLYDELTVKMIDIEADRENLQSLSTSGTQSLLCDVTDNVNFAHDFNHFLEEKTDVTFVLENLDGKKEFFAHQCVLAMKSSYFADEFCEKQRNGDKLVIHLKNINPKAFKDMIRYCYNFEPCLRTTEETCALLEVAFQFKVVSLVDVCQAFLKEARIEPGNVFSLLFVSQKTGDKGLVEKCNKFLQDQTKEVIESYELCNVTPLMVHTILDLPKLSLCFEYELIKWIFDWAKVKCQEKDSVCNSAREYLEKLLQDMNFLALTFEEFVALCKNNPEFFSSGEFQSISMTIASPETMEMPDWYDKDLKIRTYTGVKE